MRNYFLVLLLLINSIANAEVVRKGATIKGLQTLEDGAVLGTTSIASPLGRMAYSGTISTNNAFLHQVVAGAVNYGLGVDTDNFMVLGTLTGVDTWGNKGLRITPSGVSLLGYSGMSVSSSAVNRSYGGFVVGDSVLPSSTTDMTTGRMAITGDQVQLYVFNTAGAAEGTGSILLGGQWNSSDDNAMAYAGLYGGAEASGTQQSKFRIDVHNGSTRLDALSIASSTAVTLGHTSFTGVHAANGREFVSNAGDGGNSNFVLATSGTKKWYFTNNASSSDKLEIYNDDPVPVASVTQDGVWQIGSTNWIGEHLIYASAPSTATAGSATLPANPRGFLAIKVNGISVRIPYYNP